MATEPKAGRSMTRLSQLKVKSAPGGRVTSGAQNSTAIAKVPLTVEAVLGQTADLVQILDSTGAVLAKFNASGVPTFPAGSLAIAALAAGSITEDKLVVPSAIGLGALRMAHAKYDFAVDGGAAGLITPASNATIPINAIVFGGIINVTTALLAAGGAANISIGTAAGSSATSIKGATAKATYALNALLATVPVFTAATAFKMSAAGAITVTPDTNNLTAGVMEIFVVYFVASA